MNTNHQSNLPQSWVTSNLSLKSINLQLMICFWASNFLKYKNKNVHLECVYLPKVILLLSCLRVCLSNLSLNPRILFTWTTCISGCSMCIWKVEFLDHSICNFINSYSCPLALPSSIYFFYFFLTQQAGEINRYSSQLVIPYSSHTHVHLVHIFHSSVKWAGVLLHRGNSFH